MIYKLAVSLAIVSTAHGAALVGTQAVHWTPAAAARTSIPVCQIPVANGATGPGLGGDDDSLPLELVAMPGAEPPPILDLDSAVEAVAAEAAAVDGAAEASAAEEASPAEEEEEKEAYDPDRPPLANFNINPETIAHLAGRGITNMTPIQAQSFDLLREGRDMLGRSRTGTGKTLAFSLPLVERLKAQLLEMYDGARPPRGRAPSMLVLAPTRELAKQVGEVIMGLSESHGLFVSIFTGGSPYPPQQRALNSGIDILVGTPGRIIDHLNNGDLDLSQLQSTRLT